MMGSITPVRLKVASQLESELIGNWRREPKKQSEGPPPVVRVERPVRPPPVPARQPDCDTSREVVSVVLAIKVILVNQSGLNILLVLPLVADSRGLVDVLRGLCD